MNTTKTLLVLSGALLVGGWSAAEETLPPLKEGKAPTTVPEMWAGFDPRKEPLDVEVLQEWTEEGVVIRVLRYRIGTFKGKKAMMAAVFGYPKAAKGLPGLVQIHGGGQYADANAVLANAKRGYATISIAWAGRIRSKNYQVSPAQVRLFWEGKTDHPDYRVTTDWGPLDAYHAPSREKETVYPSAKPTPFTIDPVESPRNSPWFLSALGARRALTFLEQQPQVDPKRLGVYGHSMGGKLTVMTAAADKRVKAAAPTCGGVSDRYKGTPLFKATIGDQPNLRGITCPILFQTPSNDFHGRISDLQLAVEEVQSKDWRISSSPHANHQDLPEYEMVGMLWLDHHLQGGQELPTTPEMNFELVGSRQMPLFMVRPESGSKPVAVDIYFTQQGLREGEFKDHENTKARFWQHAQGEEKNGWWSVPILPWSDELPLWVYADVTYEAAKPVAGAGYYYRRYVTKRYHLSSRMVMIPPGGLKGKGLVTEEGKRSADIEGFEEGWEKEWYTLHPEMWGHRTHKVHHPRWKAPEGARLSVEIRSKEAKKMAIGVDDYGADVDLTGDGEWQKVVLTPGALKNAHGEPLQSWEGIKELRLMAQDWVRGRRDGENKAREYGEPWKGEGPEFRRLRWK